MPFSEPFDETTPTDADYVSNGDDAIRQVKRGMSERMASVMSGWPDGPLVLLGNSIDEEQITGLAVTEPKLADDSVSTRTIVDGAVHTEHIADTAVTAAKLANGSVTNAKIEDVAYAKVTDVQVEAADIVNGAVDGTKIADDAIDTNHIRDNSITGDKLASDAVDLTGLVKATAYSFNVGTTSPADNLNAGTYDEIFPIAGATTADFYVFQWTTINGTGGNQEVFPHVVAATNSVRIYFRDTGLGPTDIRNLAFRLLQLRFT